MKADEGIDISKMAVTALVVCIVLGAIVAIWWLSYSSADKALDKMTNTINSATMDRLWDFDDTSKAVVADNRLEDAVLVTSVVSAISELPEDALLFVYVDPSSNSGDASMFTYDGVTITNINVAGVDTPTTYRSNLPLTEASKELLKYSKHRCLVTISETTWEQMKYVGIAVQVLQ